MNAVPAITIINRNNIFIGGRRAKRLMRNSSRDILEDDFGKYILKIEWEDDKYSRYLKQTEGEIYIWKNVIKKEDRKYFAPIIKYRQTGKYSYILQPKLYFRRGKRKASDWKIIDDIADKYGIRDIYEDGNWATTKEGNPIIYDYGLYKDW